MSDIEHLIIAVEGFPCLWDVNNEDYHNRDMKDLAWQQICKEIDTDWETLDATQKLNSCNNIKKKWNHIRDYYRKDLQKSQNTPTGSGAKKHKSYTYAPFLEFLRPVFERRQSQGNHDVAANVPNLDPSPEEDPLIQNEENNVVQHSTASPISPEVHGCSSQVSTKIIKKKKDVPTAILDILQRRTQQAAPITTSKEDDDDKFLLSFRSDMKKMNHSQKLDFKIGMLQLMKNITSSNEFQNSRPSTSSSSYLSSNPGTPLSDTAQPAASNPHVPNTNYGYFLNIPELNQTNITSPTPPNNPRVVIQSVTNIPQYQTLGDADDNYILGDYLLLPKDKSS